MPFFSGFANTFANNLAQSRQEEADRAERQNSLEAGILTHLSTSPDPEIAAHGVTGLIDLANPKVAYKRASGLQGFLGKMATHPALPTIQGLIAQGRQVTTPAHTPEDVMPGASEGLPGGVAPGQAVDFQGQPTSTSAAGAPAAVPPPPPKTPVPGDVYTPASTTTVPRTVFLDPAAQAGAEAEAQRKGVLNADIDTWNRMSPQERQAIYGHILPITHTVDGAGNVHFFQGGVEISQDQGAGKATGPEAAAQERAQEIMAQTPGTSLEAALTQARTEQRQFVVSNHANTLATQTARIQEIAGNTLRTWQATHGTTPLTPAQARDEAFKALNTARATLGTGPDVTPEDVEATAREIMRQLGSPNGASPGAPSTPPPPGPRVSPTRAALTTPLGQGVVAGGAQPGPGHAPVPTPQNPATPPPAPGAGGANPTSIVPPHLQGTSLHPKYYSPEGKQTIQALDTAEPMLRSLIAHIQEGGLADNNSIVGEEWNKQLYNWGISPGDYEEQRTQLEGMARAYGLRGLIGGRSNQVLQKTFGQHLVEPGDSPKLTLQKAQGILAQLPVIREAVDHAESLTVGGKGKGAGGGGGSASTAPPPGPGGAGPAGPAAGAVPAAVKAALKDVPAGKHTLSDGSVWNKDAAGTITPVAKGK